MSAGRPLPDLDHPLYGPFWAAAAARRLSMQRCDACGYVRWPPEPLCPECLTAGGTWSELDGGGSVWSFAVYEHAFDDSLRAELPYVCALVELDAGPRMIARLVGAEPAAFEIGMRVAPAFEEIAAGVVLPCFAPLAGGPSLVALPD
jgi:uncharacterized OB-fold protein